ncbi:MAG: TetR/AcrR family transcriptional regulator [Acidimicrobiia bacterium]
MATARLTREEKKARTRERLLEAAATVFARRGFVAASLDEIAEEAGLTKGAVYSNFESKEDLVFAVLDDNFSRRLHDIVGSVDFDAPAEEQIRSSGLMLMARNREEEWLLLLSFEFLTYAARNPEFRARYNTGHRKSLATMAEIIRSVTEEHGWTSPLPPEQLAIVANALGVGLAVERLQNPDGVPDELFGTVLSLLYRGALADGEQTID